MNIQQIMATTPHRYPFLLVDRMLEIDHENLTAVGIKNVTMNEPHFMGHFPGQPIMPGVLIMEALAQTTGMLVLSIEEYKGKVPLFVGVERMKLRRKVVPGDQLRLEISIPLLKKRFAKARVKALVDGETAAEGVMIFSFADSEA